MKSVVWTKVGHVYKRLWLRFWPTQNIDYTRHVYGCGPDLQLTPTLKQVRFTNSSFGLNVMFHLLPSGTPDALLTELYSSDLLTEGKIPIMQDPLFMTGLTLSGRSALMYSDYARTFRGPLFIWGLCEQWFTCKSPDPGNKRIPLNTDTCKLKPGVQRVYSGHLHARSPFNENPPSCADSIYSTLPCVDGRC